MQDRTLFPLSGSQLNIRAVEHSCPGTSVNVIGTTLRIHGRFDPRILRESIAAVLRSDASLRTRITDEGGTLMQYHAEYEEEDYPLYDFSMSGPESIGSWEEAVTREAMPLFDAPLFRFFLFRSGEQDGGLLVKLHHIISDGWSQVMLCNRIGSMYLDMLSGAPAEAEEAPDYAAYVEDERKYLASPAYARDEEYWRGVLARAGEPSSIKTVSGAAVSRVGRRMSYVLPQSLNNKIYTFCTRNRVSPFSAMYLALAVYFRRIGGADRFTIGVPVFNRSDYTFRRTSGMFVSTVPFCSGLDGSWSMTECCEHMTEDWLDMLRHQRLPFERIRALAAEAGAGGDLFHIVLSYQNGQMLTGRDAAVSFSGRWHYCGYQMEQLCIHLNNLEDDRRYAVDYDYLTQVFSDSEISALHSCLMNILSEGLDAPDMPISSLSVLSAQEREKVLYTFNGTDTVIYDADLYDRFLRIEALHPDRAAVIYAGKRTTYAELERMAQARHAAIAADSPCLAAVMLPRGPELLASMLGILRAGSAFLLIPADLPEGRVRQILASSGASVLFTDSAELPDLSGLSLRVIRGVPVSGSVPPAEAGADDLAYVVYTSGSTGAPKGVEISRRSLLNLADAMKPVYGKGAVLSLCSIGFDAFILESAAALLNGQTVLFPEPGEAERPERLAELIRGYGAGFISTTPSRLGAYMKNPGFLAALRRVESIVCGGEAFPAYLLHQLRAATDARIHNQYGPSEATVGVSLALLDDAAAITAGKPMQNCRLYVLDEWLNPLPVGVYGRLYVGGACVGIGYRNDPELTAERFAESPFILGERIYDTGDTACWTEDGEIVLGGRADSQIKLRGLRVEPQEAAECLCRHPQIRECAVTVREIAGQTALAAYYTADSVLPEAELRSFAASYLPWYMVPAVMTRVDAIPLTANGKVDEKLLPEPEISAGPQRAETELEKKLVAIFSEVLGRNDIDAGSDYFLCGGSSLNAMETAGAVAERLGLSLKISDMYVFRTARQLAGMLGDAPEAERLTPAPEAERFPLSPIQQGIYVQSMLDPTGTAYMMPGAFTFSHEPDVGALKKAFRALGESEKLLRTAFTTEPDGIFARVMPGAELTLEVIRGADRDAECRRLLEPFDLAKAPLMRARLLECGGEWTLLVNVHHMIGDGLTTPILMRRLDALCRGRSEEAPELSYLDYAWYRSHSGADGLEYWKETLRSLPEPLELPADYKGTRSFDYVGDSVSFAPGAELSAKCEDFCRSLGISRYALSLGAFALLLSRLAGQRDLIVGAPAAGRTLPETRDMCGPFINTLPVRLNADPGQTVRGYLLGVRDAVNGMLDHQYAGLEDIAGALGIRHTLSQSPLFSVMFTERPLDADSFSLGGNALTYRPVATGTAKMDLVFELAHGTDGLSFTAEYASSLFERETVCFWCRCFTQTLRSMVSDADATLESVVSLAAADRIALIDTPDNTAVPFVNMPIHMQIEQRTELDPGAEALVFHDRTYTRAELDSMARRTAKLLSDAGVLPGSAVGLALERGAELAAAMMGILKAGCGYVPLMVSLPAQRLRHMTETARMTHIVCSEKTRGMLPPDLGCTLVCVEDGTDDDFTTVPVRGDGLCNVLFTSGSTGKPKGVMLLHRSVANMQMNIAELIGRADGPILCTTNIGFDSFIAETLLSFAAGKKVVMCDEEEMMLPWKVAEKIEKYGVEIVQFTPARFQMLLSNDTFRAAAKRLRLILFGGEVLTQQLVSKTRAVTDAVIVNMYGPTEATVYMTMTDILPGKPISIGRPLKNGRIYVLDGDGRRVLPTAYGELWLSGEVLSAGYVSNPGLTDEMFRPDPFFPGEKMYRTGDIARLRTDGCYDFLGRRDSQVKLNGQRVELDEISGAVTDSGFAVLAATVPVRHADASMQLVTFYQPSPENPGTAEDITAYLKTVLPAYMIPSRLTALDAMPYTPSSKIDLRALREAAEASDTAAAQPDAATGEAPAAEPPSGASVPEVISAIWRRVLGRDGIDPGVSFFDQGGTSLAALNVLSQYHNAGLVLTMQDFYENPTVDAQSAMLGSVRAAEPEAPPAEKTYIPVPAPPARPAVRGADVGAMRAAVRAAASRASVGTVFLTGATGFMGAHVLAELARGGADRIICLVRGGAERLREALLFYFGEDFGGVTEAVEGDMTLPNFGLSAEKYADIAGRICAVWHSAADVRHYAADEESFLGANLTGTENAIALARAAGAVLYHFSTTSVSGNRLRGSGAHAVFTENDFDIGQDWRSNLYVKSKFLAERAVIDAVRGGLSAKIFRLGRLVGRAEDGVFQRNPGSNAFWLTLRAVHALGAIPEGLADMPVEMTPVDRAAQAAFLLRNAPLTVYHVFSPAPYTAAEIVRAVSPGIAVLPQDAFERRLAEASRADTRAVLAPLLDMLRRLAVSPQTVDVTNEATVQLLDAAGFDTRAAAPEMLLRGFSFAEDELL